ncbi:Hypothetical protein PHPALM_6290 [Phytophthora palmivora]|uniref:BED-type domain-containing protein n=1 Tax=Phytophthora palmivora TaxID=4796 RepID=A0A2P4YF74_9STRA|nr:Hypothetical protein PHPALM_6290 [Phytophthora palmivora]
MDISTTIWTSHLLICLIPNANTDLKSGTKPEFWYLAPNFLNEHAEFAYCTKCSVKIPFKTSNHQVVPHMERFHPNDLGTSRPIERNLTAEFADTAGNIREIIKEEQEQMNGLLARWISAHFCPLLLVEDKGFIEFVTYITQTLGCVNVPLPKRTQLRRCIIIFANELREYIQGMISESCDYYSITADIWTAPNSRSYIAFTIHYVDEDLNPRNWTLEVKEIPGRES